MAIIIKRVFFLLSIFLIWALCIEICIEGARHLHQRYCVSWTSDEHLACSLRNIGGQSAPIDDWTAYENTIREKYASKEDQIFYILEHWHYDHSYWGGCMTAARILNRKRYDALKEKLHLP